MWRWWPSCNESSYDSVRSNDVERVSTVMVGNKAMREAVGASMAGLPEWQNFYVIVGSSAGALIGLQFVVIALLGQRISVRAKARQVCATPNVAHFSSGLLRDDGHVKKFKRQVVSE